MNNKLWNSKDDIVSTQTKLAYNFWLKIRLLTAVNKLSIFLTYLLIKFHLLTKVNKLSVIEICLNRGKMD